MDSYQLILEKHDDAVRWDFPEDFDYSAEQQEFFKAKDRLQAVLRDKLEFETGSYIQDASYHSQILLDSKYLNRPGAYAQIRFSNFGKMVSFANEDWILAEVKVDIIQHLSNLGYNYIPEETLLQQYTGGNKGVSGIENWWVRYFDFV